MKRSEMIDEITCVLLSYGSTYPQYSLQNLQQLAEEILKMQENKKMKPPTVYTEDSKYAERGVTFHPDNKVKPYIKYQNEWEPEDET